MDRFIAALSLSTVLTSSDLKSNMDRFIAHGKQDGNFSLKI